MRFKSKKQNILTLYIYCYLVKNKNLLNNVYKGKDIKYLSISDLENLEIPIPSIKEQQEFMKSKGNEWKFKPGYGKLTKFIFDILLINI